MMVMAIGVIFINTMFGRTLQFPLQCIMEVYITRVTGFFEETQITLKNFLVCENLQINI